MPTQIIQSIPGREPGEQGVQFNDVPDTTYKPSLMETLTGQSFSNPFITPNINKSYPTPSATGTAQIDSSGSPAIIPQTSTTYAKSEGLINQNQALIDSIKKQIENLQAQIPAAQAEEVRQAEATKQKGVIAGVMQKIQDSITQREQTASTQKSATELRQEAISQVYKEMGITPEQVSSIGTIIGEINSYNKQMADIQNRKQKALDAIEGRAGIDVANMDAETNRISKAFNSEITAVGTLAAVKNQELQMIQGAYKDAQATSKDIVALSTHDQEQALADIEWTKTAYKDLYTLMTTDEQNAWNRQYTEAKDALTAKKLELTNISKYVTNPETADAFKGVDWTKLTEADATNLVNQYISSPTYLTKQKILAQASSISNIVIDTSNVDTWANGLMTGQFGLQNVPMGIRDAVLNRINQLGGNVISPTFSGKAKEAIAAFNTAEGMLNTIESLSSPLTTAGNFITSNIGGALNWLGGKTGASSEARLYMQEKQAFLSQLTRASGERGVLTQQDVGRIENALPKLNDTQELAQKKLQILRDLFYSIKQGTVSTYTQPLTTQKTTTGTTSGGMEYTIIP